MDFVIERLMREALLPAGLFSKSVIAALQGTPAYDLDTWPRELVNFSQAFMKKTGYELFRVPDDESEGQCDAITNRYSLDFKFVLGNSAQHAVRETSAGKIKVDNGITLTCVSRSKGDRQAVRLHAVLRECSLSKLRELRDRDPRQECSSMAERDLAYLMRSLDKDKNLLLILPLLIYADNHLTLPVPEMNRMLFIDFNTVFALRREMYPRRENYLGYFHEGRFIVAQAYEDELAEFDAISVRDSPAFMEILSHYSKVDYLLMDRLLGSLQGDGRAQVAGATIASKDATGT